ncbi:MAG TPA: hypothetical protein VLT88_02630, partial [Desulfosarcina sp.]|nr:hypothetical protein [Desulfosarcina sp.]
MRSLARQRYFLDYTLRALWRRRWKHAALLGVYTVTVFVVASILFFSDSLRRDAGVILQDTPELVVQRMTAGRHALMPESYADRIGRIRGASNVRPRLWGYYYHPAAKANYTLMVPPHADLADDAVKIGAGVMRTWATARENRLYFRTFDGQSLVMTIVETFSGATDLVTADLILMSESAFRRITGVPAGFATDLVARIRNPKEGRTVTAKIVQQLPDTRPILREEIQRTYDTIFDWRSGYLLAAFSGAVLAFFIFAWDKATGLSAEER